MARSIEIMRAFSVSIETPLPGRAEKQNSGSIPGVAFRDVVRITYLSDQGVPNTLKMDGGLPGETILRMSEGSISYAEAHAVAAWVAPIILTAEQRREQGKVLMSMLREQERSLTFDESLLGTSREPREIANLRCSMAREVLIKAFRAHAQQPVDAVTGRAAREHLWPGLRYG